MSLARFAWLAAAVLAFGCNHHTAPPEEGRPIAPRSATTAPATIAPALTASTAPEDAPRVLGSGPCSLPDDDVLARLVAPPPGKGPHAQGAGSAPPATPGAPDAEIQSMRASVQEGRCRRIEYLSEGLRIFGFVLEPPGAKPAPAILVARGGNRDLGKVGPRLLLDMNALADEGFVMVATQYRGADGGEGQDEFGGADLADLENLVPLARSLPSVDPNNLFLLGYSRGAMMATMALRNRLPVRAAALFSGCYDLEAVAARHPVMEKNFRELIPGYETRRAEELQRRSAIAWASEIETPVLLLGGTRDERVAFDIHTARLAKALAEAGRDPKLVSYDDDHTLSRHRAESRREIVSWFRAHLVSER